MYASDHQEAPGVSPPKKTISPNEDPNNQFPTLRLALVLGVHFAVVIARVKFFARAAFALGAASTLLGGVVAEPRPEPKVGRLISKRHLEKRGLSFVNGGDQIHGGKGPDGKQGPL